MEVEADAEAAMSNSQARGAGGRHGGRRIVDLVGVVVVVVYRVVWDGVVRQWLAGGRERERWWEEKFSSGGVATPRRVSWVSSHLFPITNDRPLSANGGWHLAATLFRTGQCTPGVGEKTSADGRGS